MISGASEEELELANVIADKLLLQKENQELKEKLDKYENPEDMTLFAMWCTEKVKEENEKLKKQFEVGEEHNITDISLLDENNKLKIQISARETLCEEYEQLINTILNFSLFKEECPLNFGFEDKSKEDKAQNIFYNDEYCENNCNDNYKDCWLKYFKKLQELEGSDSNVKKQ